MSSLAAKSARSSDATASRHSSKRKRTEGHSSQLPATGDDTRHSKDKKRSINGSHSRRSPSHSSHGASSKSFQKRVLSDIEESVRENSLKKCKEKGRQKSKDGKGKSSDSLKRQSSKPKEYQNVQNSACCNVVVEKSSSSLGDYLAISCSLDSCDLSDATQILSESDCGACPAMADCPYFHRCPKPASEPCDEAIDVFVPCDIHTSSDSIDLSCGESQQPLLISSHETEVNFDGQDVFTLRTREVETLHSPTCCCLICRTGNNNYIRSGQIVKSVEIWGSDTTSCMERQLAVCLQEEPPCDGATRKPRKESSYPSYIPYKGGSEASVGMGKEDTPSSGDQGEMASDIQIQ